MELNLGLHRTYSHIFIVAHVNSPIFGTNFFLQKFGLIIDLNGQCLRDLGTHLKTYGLVRSGTPLCLSGAYANQDDTFLKLLKEFPSITIPSFHKEVFPHTFKQNIEVSGSPIHHKVRHLSPDKLEAAKDFNR